MQLLRASVTPVLNLVISEDESYLVELPFSAVKAAEAELDRDLKHPSAWFGARAHDLPALLHAGLLKHQPGTTREQAEAICEKFGVEGCKELTEALGALAFPKFLEEIKAAMAKKAEGKLPNGQSAALN